MIYQRLRDLREDRDLTQAQLAEILHVSLYTYASYERGKRSVSLEILSTLADFYATSVDYLTGRTDEKKPYPKSRNPFLR